MKKDKYNDTGIEEKDYVYTLYNEQTILDCLHRIEPATFNEIIKFTGMDSKLIRKTMRPLIRNGYIKIISAANKKTQFELGAGTRLERNGMI